MCLQFVLHVKRATIRGYHNETNQVYGDFNLSLRLFLFASRNLFERQQFAKICQDTSLS